MRKKLKGKDITIGFSDRQISPWGGFALLQEFFHKVGFYDFVKSLNLPFPGSNRGYNPTHLLVQFIVMSWCGGRNFSDIEIIRYDEVLKKIFGWRAIGGRMTLSRFFSNFGEDRTESMLAQTVQWLNKLVPEKDFTLDIDTTTITRYGKQEGAKKGYNAQKKGRLSHSPILAVVPETKMVANFKLREGNTYSSTGFVPFFEQTLRNLEGKTVKLVRADSGFYDKKILSFLEEKSINYIFAVKLYEALQRKLYNIPDWIKVEDGIEICEFQYASKEKQPNGELPDKRRYVAVRQSASIRPDAPGKTLSLFAKDPAIFNWRYGLLVTNMMDLPEDVWRSYRLRADSENRIKELKYDFGLDSFNMKSLEGTESTLVTAMFAFNLMSLFRQLALGEMKRHTLSTLHGKLFALAAFFDNKKSESIMHLLICVPRKKRAWFTGIWNQVSQPP